MKSVLILAIIFISINSYSQYRDEDSLYKSYKAADRRIKEGERKIDSINKAKEIRRRKVVQWRQEIELLYWMHRLKQSPDTARDKRLMADMDSFLNKPKQ